MSFTITDTVSDTKDYDYDYELSDNVVEDIIEYSRANIVKNEEQFVLTTLAYITGYMDDPRHFVSAVLIGTAGSGKSHVQNKIEELFPESHLYEATSGSDTSIIYDDSWDHAYIASLDELQKPSDKLIEILKSLHGGEDEEFKYKVTSDGRGADREVDEIVKKPMPYFFLYAQYEPDFEMWDRLLKVPVHESKEKNDGVGATQWDHSMISFDDSDVEYMFEFEDGKKALKDHIQNLPKDAEVKIPAGEDEFGWDAYKHSKHIFDINRSETNRVSGMVANLVRSSALLNHKNRDTTVVIEDGEPVEKIVAEPQDVANVLFARDVLLATTHQLDRKKKSLCLAIKERGGSTNSADIPSIIDYLRETNASFVKRSQVEAMLQDLIDNHLVEKLPNAGKNGRHEYQFTGFHQLGTIDVTEDFKETFSDTVNPMSGESFIDYVKEQNNSLRPSVEDFMSEGGIETDSKTGTEEQQTLEPTSPLDELGPLESEILQRLHQTVDGRIIGNIDKREPTVEQLLGFVPFNEDPDDHDLSGTIFDPEKPIWAHKTAVEERKDVDKHIQQAMESLKEDGLWETKVMKRNGKTPTEIKIEVAEPV